MSTKTTVVKDFNNFSLLVTRDFNAPVEMVWRAYSEAALLDQWWAPAPWRAETHHMDFTPGGYWLYAMVSPEGEKHFGRMDYTAIDKHHHFEMRDVFCDENGNPNHALPAGHGRNNFIPVDGMTRVEAHFYYPDEASLKTVIEMGMEQGITMCMEQLAVLLEKK